MLHSNSGTVYHITPTLRGESSPSRDFCRLRFLPALWAACELSRDKPHLISLWLSFLLGYRLSLPCGPEAPPPPDPSVEATSTSQGALWSCHVLVAKKKL